MKEYIKTESAPLILLQENIVNLEEFKAKVQDALKNKEVKTQVVGYVQRGGNSTKYEQKMAKNFAQLVTKNINNNIFNVMVCYNKNNNKFENLSII